jgi:hypothetical protein
MVTEDAMSFEIVEAGTFRAVEPLSEGECSVSRNGTMTARAEDLATIGVTNYAIILADPETLRIGLRGVRDGEQMKSVAASMIKRKSGTETGRRRMNISQALKRLNVTAEAIAGRYTLMNHGDEFLFVTLTEAKEIPRPQEPRRTR